MNEIIIFVCTEAQFTNEILICFGFGVFSWCCWWTSFFIIDHLEDSKMCTACKHFSGTAIVWYFVWKCEYLDILSLHICGSDICFFTTLHLFGAQKKCVTEWGKFHTESIHHSANNSSANHFLKMRGIVDRKHLHLFIVILNSSGHMTKCYLK